MKQFLERGSRGNLATLRPMFRNSIGADKRPCKYGIHGITEPIPDGKPAHCRIVFMERELEEVLAS